MRTHQWNRNGLEGLRRRRLLLLVLLGLLFGGCQSSDETVEAERAEGIRVGSFDFVESEVVAELYAQTLENEGLPVVRLGVVGPREIVAPAMEAGLIDVVPEYTGTAAQHYVDGASAASIDEALEERGMALLAPAPAETVNVFVVTASTATAHQLERISDLSTWPTALRLGGPVECPTRPLCLVGLSEVYGVEIDQFLPQRSLAVTAEALIRNEIDVGVMFSTAAELVSGPFVVLDDDRGLQPHDYITPLVRLEAQERWGSPLTEALDRLSAGLTTDEVQRLNQQVADGTPIEVAVDWWLRTSGGQS